MKVFVATVTDTDEMHTEVVGVYTSLESAQRGCQRYLDGSLDADDQDTLIWNSHGTYADVDMFDFSIDAQEVQE